MAFSNQLLERLREAILGASFNQSFGPSNVMCGSHYCEPAYAGYPAFHQGVDLTLPGGNSAGVQSVASGVVIQAGANGGYGNSVTVRAPNGFMYLLGHMSNLFNPKLHRWTQVGDVVQAGDYIGTQGSTGASTGTHVHIEVRTPASNWHAGQPVDLGSNTKQVFYSLYHALGFGGGYLTGQIDAPPSPTQTNTQLFNVPVPLHPGKFGLQSLPTYADIAGDPGSTPPGTTPGDPFGGTSGGGTVYPGGNDPNAGGILGAITGPLSAIGDFFTKFSQFFTNPGDAFASGFSWFSRDLWPTIVVFSLGGTLFLVGLVQLGKEKPVQAVIQPVKETGNAITNTGKKGAEIVAMVAK